jgi:hypothetical protein
MLHVLDAAGDLHVLATRRDALGGLIDRLQTRAAVAVDRDAAHLDRQSRDERRHAGHVVALFFFLLDAAPLDVLDGRARHADAVEQGLHQVGAQIVGADIAIHAFFGVSPADGRADGIDDDGITHDTLLY